MTTMSLSAQKIERGPYTLEKISDNIYRIEDYNSVRGRGSYTNTMGQTEYNNCSDMYLIVGRSKALLIDLSNNIHWADDAAESLRSLVNKYAQGRELVITITHLHGDHLGMLPAYFDDTQVRFWVPKSEFAKWKFFPKKRTTFFADNASIDLGGTVIKTLKVEGHTPGSTLFFVEGRDIVFTGDAIGSGNGVWIFSAEGFSQYKRGIAKLIKFINNPANGINKDKLVIQSGHSVQIPAEIETLGIQYILDMSELIRRIEAGSGYETIHNEWNTLLDTHYKYGTATITWSRAAEKKYFGKKARTVVL